MNFENWIPIIYEPKTNKKEKEKKRSQMKQLRLNRTKYIAQWLYYQFNKCTPTFSRFRVFVLSQLSVFSPLSEKFNPKISQIHIAISPIHHAVYTIHSFSSLSIPWFVQFTSLSQLISTIPNKKEKRKKNTPTFIRYTLHTPL